MRITFSVCLGLVVLAAVVPASVRASSANILPVFNDIVSENDHWSGGHWSGSYTQNPDVASYSGDGPPSEAYVISTAMQVNIAGIPGFNHATLWIYVTGFGDGHDAVVNAGGTYNGYATLYGSSGIEYVFTNTNEGLGWTPIDVTASVLQDRNNSATTSNFSVSANSNGQGYYNITGTSLSFASSADQSYAPYVALDVPEPATMSLLGLGLGTLIARRRLAAK